MDKVFESFVKKVEELYEKLIKMAPVSVSKLPVPKDVPEWGVYLFSSKRDKPLYVGRTNRQRTNRLRQRLQEHCRLISTHNQAPFAFRLARERTGKKAASYTKKDSRSELEKNEEFSLAFSEAKDCIREMNVRYVKAKNPKQQALLEMYVAIRLKTKHNDLENH